MNRKLTESNAPNPPIQVVGFRVEGTVSPSPSPAMKSVLSDSVDKEHSSGKPVIIPPSFKFNEEQEDLARSTSDPLVGKVPVQRTLTAPAGSYSNKVAENDGQLPVLLDKPGLVSASGDQSSMVNGNSKESTEPNLSVKKESGLPPTQKVNPIVEEQQPQQVNNSSQTSTSLSRDNDARILDGQGASVSSGGGGVGGTNQAQGQSQPDIPSSKKPTTRAERRALQEKQKAEKAARQEAIGKGGGQKSSQKSQENEKTMPVSGVETLRKVSATKQQEPKISSQSKSTRVIEWFAHLPQFKEFSYQDMLECREAQNAHPLILQLGKRILDGAIKGGCARCVAMLETIIKVIQDYQTPEGKELSRDVGQYLNAQIAFLVRCRPLSASMGNAIRALKHDIMNIDPSEDESVSKQHLIDQITTYIQEKITFAGGQLCEHAVSKIKDRDVIMTYGYSTVVLRALLLGWQQGKRFQVIVVDSRPKLEGRKFLQKLIQQGISCQYTHLNAICYCMKEVSKVLLGASSVCSNGTIINTVGTAAVAACAAHLSKPVLVLCETCKFSERVQLDSFTSNEMNDANELIRFQRRGNLSTQLLDWENEENLGLLNQRYDLTKAEHVTMIVTELGMLPPTSVLAVIREYRQEQQGIVLA